MGSWCLGASWGLGRTRREAHGELHDASHLGAAVRSASPTDSEDRNIL